MEGIAAFWWQTLPRVTARYSRTLGAALADGSYLASNQALGALLPPAALLLGVTLAKLQIGDSFGSTYTYTFSLPVMAIMAAVGVLAAGLGFWVVIGFALGDLLLIPHPPFDPTQSLIESLARNQLALVIGYILLFQLLVAIPLVASAARKNVPAVFGPLRGPAGAVMGAVVLGALVWLWTQGVPTLIRPVFTWPAPGTSPPTAAVVPLQETGWVLILVAIAVLVARVAAEAALGRTPVTAPSRPAQPSRLAEMAWSPARAVLRAGLTTLVLGGILDAGLAVAVFIGTAILFWLRDLLANALPSWATLIARVPFVIRLGSGLIIAYLAANQLVNAYFAQPTSGEATAASFFPVLVSVIAGFAVMSILFPPRQRQAAN